MERLEKVIAVIREKGQLSDYLTYASETVSSESLK
jgi:hypothetical protein